MKPIPGLAALLDKGNAKHVFGTKERSFIKQANPAGIKAIVDQQFEFGGADYTRLDSYRSSSRKWILRSPGEGQGRRTA